MTDTSLEPIAVNVATALKLAAIGRTTLYQLISDKKIRSFRVGTRRLIDLASLRAFLESQEA